MKWLYVFKYFYDNQIITTETLDFITSSLVEGNSVDEILLDFAKAFD